jgi:uncharacterized protein DUF4410
MMPAAMRDRGRSAFGVLRCALAALLLAGCIGAYRVAPVAPGAVGTPGPLIEDPEAGLVSVAPGFRLADYPVILIDLFKVSDSEINDGEDRHLAGLIPSLFQSEVIARMRAAGLFDRVVNIADGGTAPPNIRAARLEGVITRLGAGNRALRYMVGFGAGASKAQLETRLVDSETGRVLIATADRREASFGLFGGDSEEHLREAFSDMARDYARLLSRLRPAVGAAAITNRSGDATPLDTTPLGGRWRQPGRDGTLDITYRGAALAWEYTRTNSPYGTERSNGTGSVSGNEISLVGQVVAGYGQSVGRSFNLTLRREGARLIGTAFGAYNLPRSVIFERGQ